MEEFDANPNEAQWLVLDPAACPGRLFTAEIQPDNHPICWKTASSMTNLSWFCLIPSDLEGGGCRGFHTVFGHLLLNIQVVVHFCHGYCADSSQKNKSLAVFSFFVFGEKSLSSSLRVVRVFGTNARSCSEHLTKITVGREPKSRHAWRKCIQASHVSRVSAQDAPRLRGDTGRPVTTLLRLHPCHLTSSSLEVCSPSTLPQHASLPARQTRGPSSLLHRFYLIYLFVLLFLAQSRAERSQRGLWNTLCTGSKLIYTLRRR